MAEETKASCKPAKATNRFTGKTAIVTGGASGIGRAIVERLASEGATVGIFDINKDAGKEVADGLTSKGQKVEYFNIDVTDESKCFEGVKSFTTKHGNSLNYLVNCAVYFGCKGIDAVKADWDKSFTVNCVGYANMVKATNEPMKTVQGIYGKSIVNIASTAAHRAQPERWTYSATKGAIVMMTRCMALDLSKDNIRVNCVSPAWVWSPEVSKAAKGDRAKWEPIWGKFHMLRRFCETTEVASGVCFLLSDDASYITGNDLPIEGGYMSMSPEGFGEQSSFAGSDY